MSVNQLDAIIGRLTNYFDVVSIGTPANAHLLDSIKAHIPYTADDLLLFYKCCNGIKVGLDDTEVGEIFDIERLIESYPVALDVQLVSRFLPIRGDGCGDYDCLIVGPGVGENAVFFWDHELYDGPAYLLGSSIWSYLDMWSDHLIHKHMPNGTTDSRYIPPNLEQWPWTGNPEQEHPWPFDKAWMCERDFGAKELFSSPTIRKWLMKQDNL